jgi:transcriptional regulator with XRE-family HTH domain
MARLTLRTSQEVLSAIGQRARALRLSANLTQAELSVRADVALRSLQRFENTGRASMELAVRVAFVLGVEDEMELLFRQPEATSVDEFLGSKQPRRQRARGSK